ncbi:unnamed protein product [Schistosoma mattheei]|uniref:Uncharacterized protein n=1 Tax=Schistosoma mattheei TaxID=31246 RepID=A0AA85C0W9_9TREM|nr:unnamed protein product [Schistosoma mattheei]
MLKPWKQLSLFFFYSPILFYGNCLGTGITVLKALDVLRTYNVPIENVILLTLFVSPQNSLFPERFYISLI